MNLLTKSFESMKSLVHLDEEPESEKLHKEKDEMYERYEKCDQHQVFQHWPDLSEEEKQELLDQLRSIEVEKLADYFKIAKEGADVATSEGDIKPFSGNVRSASADSKTKTASSKVGMDAIRRNKVAVVLLAGGQGTRLGFSGPKGMYSIGTPSRKTLFSMVAERICKLIDLCKIIDLAGTNKGSVRIPLYIMTSPMNHATTEQYFKKHAYFGLRPDDVVFFSQGMLPCLSPDGKILMETASKCAMAPDGNGGIYPAMQKSGVLLNMSLRGIEHIHTFAIDNALVKPADPAFIGYCIQEQADCGNKVVWKNDPHEKVGIVAEKDGKPCVIEYSELSTEMAESVSASASTNKKGGLVRKKSSKKMTERLEFGAANICNHYYSLSFLENEVMPKFGNMFHIANKKIAVWDVAQKQIVTPTENNGIKLETFIFDVFPLSTSMAILEVNREDEFAPVKNAPGAASDSPDTARVMISDLAKRWMTDAGAVLTGTLDEDAICEITPLTSYAGEGLGDFFKQKVKCPFTM